MNPHLLETHCAFCYITKSVFLEITSSVQMPFSFIIKLSANLNYILVVKPNVLSYTAGSRVNLDFEKWDIPQVLIDQEL